MSSLPLPSPTHPRMAFTLSLIITNSWVPCCHRLDDSKLALRRLLPGLASNVFSLASFFTLTCLGKSPVQRQPLF